MRRFFCDGVRFGASIASFRGRGTGRTGGAVRAVSLRLVSLDVASHGIDELLDLKREPPVIEQACQLQGAVEPLQALGQAVVAIGTDGCVKDVLGSLRERN